MLHFRQLSILFLPLIFSACSPSELACTEEFRSFSIEVRTSTDKKVADASTSTFIKASGESLTFNNSGLSEGTYTVIDDSILFDDGPKAGLRIGSNELIFRVTKDGKSVEQPYISVISECHIESLEGEKPFIFN